MDFKHLRAFLAVAETGSVSRAAEMLHLVQPAVSRQIRLLEDDVGAPLFVRERHGMVLTQEGHALAGYARRAMLELDRARAEIGGTSAGVSGLVTLGLLPSTIDQVAAPLVAAAARQYPGIRMRIAMGYAGTLRRWLETGEVDAALLYGSERPSEWQATPLIEEPLWLIGPPDCGLRASRPVPLPALDGRRLILPSAPHGIRALVDHACAVARVAPDVAAETNALSVQRSLVLHGHGWTILPPSAVAEDLRGNRLAGAPLGPPAIMRTIVLALPGSRASGRSVNCVVELLVEQVRRAVTSGEWTEGRWLGPQAQGHDEPREITRPGGHR